MQGKFIVIEGADGSGKTTQVDLLKKKLGRKGKKVLIADFPRYYESIWGKMVGEFLTGKYGGFKEVDPHLSVLTYMLDQYTWSRDIGRPHLAKGGMILSNRFFTSNVHQIARLKTRAKSQFRDWLWPAGHDDLKILKPDLVLFLDVPPKIGKKLNVRKVERRYLKGRKKDNAEKDYKHQEDSYREYLFTVKHTPYWQKVRCTTGGKIDPPEVIHDRIWKIIKNYL